MKFLSFQLAETFYGVPLQQVREVIAFPEFTSIPGTSPQCLGIMSLREKIIPIIDLRIKFKIEPTLTHDTSIIVCDLGSTTVGVVVDMIHNVIAPSDAEVLSVPEGALSDAKTSSLVSQVVHREGKLTLTLNIESIINGSDKELQMLREAQSKMVLKVAV